MSRISIGHSIINDLEASHFISSHDGAQVPITLWNARQDFFPEPIIFSSATSIAGIVLPSPNDELFSVQNVQLGKMAAMWTDGSSSIWRLDRKARRSPWASTSGGSAVLSANTGGVLTGSIEIVPLNDGYAVFWIERNSAQYTIHGARFNMNGQKRAREFQVAGPYNAKPIVATAKRPQGMVIIIAHGPSLPPTSLSGIEWSFSQDLKMFDKSGFGYPYKRATFSLHQSDGVVALSVSDLSFNNVTTQDLVYGRTGNGVGASTKFSVTAISNTGVLSTRIVETRSSLHHETSTIQLDVNLDANSQVDTCALDGGIGFAVVYDRASQAGDRDIYACVVSAGMQKVVSTTRINNGTTGDQILPSVAPVMSGFLAAWYSSDIEDIVVRRVEATASGGISSSLSYFGVPLNQRSDIDVFNGSIVGANVQGVRPFTSFKSSLARENEVLLTYRGIEGKGSVGPSPSRPRVSFLPDGMVSVIFRSGNSVQEVLLRESLAKCYTGSRATPAIFLQRNAFACSTLPKFDKDIERISFSLDGIEVTNTSFSVKYYGQCPAGSYCPDHRREGSNMPISCSPGHHCPHVDMFEQVVCAPGTYQYSGELNQVLL